MARCEPGSHSDLVNELKLLKSHRSPIAIVMRSFLGGNYHLKYYRAITDRAVLLLCKARNCEYAAACVDIPDTAANQKTFRKLTTTLLSAWGY